MFFLLAVALGGDAATAPADLVPMRWPSAEPTALAVLQGTAVNCLVVPEANWNHAFAVAAHEKSLVVLGSVSPGEGAARRAKKAFDLGLDGAVLEGNFAEADVAAVRKSAAEASKLAIDLGVRGKIALGADAPPVIGTYQGVWAGINPHDEKEAHAAPSGAPWIDTNAGFLRFVRASTDRAFWLSAVPPDKTIVTLPRYLQMIADPAMVGARWILTLQPELFERLVKGEAKAVRDFKRMNQLLAFFEQHRAFQKLPAFGQLAVVEDVINGALLSGSVLDMITVKHTPVRPVPFRGVEAKAFEKAQMAVSVDPQSLDETQQKVLRDFTRGGGTVLTAPPGWRMPVPRPDQIVTDAEEVKKLDQIWREVNSMMGRRNLGVRLFNVSSMLSNMLGPTDGSRVVVYLVNYSDFPVDSIAVHLLGKYSKVQVLWPERAAKALMPYDNDDGTGVDIDILESAAILIAER